tara:strand:+ start:382 stop:666 length:285 start_codon:yes stop_codon:yes gene_type:complete
MTTTSAKHVVVLNLEIIMKLTETWVQLSNTGAVLQRLSCKAHVLLKYSGSTPSSDTDAYRIEHNNPAIMPTVTGVSLWAKAEKGTARITSTDLV